MKANSMEGLREIQQEERDEFARTCLHSEILIEDSPDYGQGRTITLRCARCRLNLLGYIVTGTRSYLSYVRECVKDYDVAYKHEESK